MNQMRLFYKDFQKKISNIKNIALFQLLELQENNQIIYFSLPRDCGTGVFQWILRNF